LPPLAETPAEIIKTAPYHDEFKGWTITDVNGGIPGGQKVNSDTAIDLYANGKDAWAYYDQLRFVWKKIKGDFEISATVDSLTFTDMYSKAGLMIRQSLDPNSSVATVGTQPDGNVEFLLRVKTGAHMTGGLVMGTQFPDVHIKLVRKGKLIQRYYAQGKMTWDKFDEIELPDLPDEPYVGIFALSHDGSRIVKAVFRDIKIAKTGE
jgi:regulation of enolase protein 1 (concanavalin A-like superfamily)